MSVIAALFIKFLVHYRSAKNIGFLLGHYTTMDIWLPSCLSWHSISFGVIPGL